MPPVRDIAVEIPKPCSADWDAMEPEARSRFCAECRTRVHDLSSMTAPQAERFLDANADREDLCVSYLHDDRGDIVFAKPNVIPARSLLRRLPVAAGLAAAMAACTPAAEVCEDEAPPAVQVEAAAAPAAPPNDGADEPSPRSLLAHPEDAIPDEVPQRAVDPDALDEPCDGGFSEPPPEPTTSTAPPTTKTPPPIHRTAGKPVVRRMGKRKRPTHLP